MGIGRLALNDIANEKYLKRNSWPRPNRLAALLALPITLPRDWLTASVPFRGYRQ